MRPLETLEIDSGRSFRYHFRAAEKTLPRSSVRYYEPFESREDRGTRAADPRSPQRAQPGYLVHNRRNTRTQSRSHCEVSQPLSLPSRPQPLLVRRPSLLLVLKRHLLPVARRQDPSADNNDIAAFLPDDLMRSVVLLAQRVAAGL